MQLLLPTLLVLLLVVAEHSASPPPPPCSVVWKLAKSGALTISGGWILASEFSLPAAGGASAAIRHHSLGPPDAAATPWLRTSVSRMDRGAMFMATGPMYSLRREVSCGEGGDHLLLSDTLTGALAAGPAVAVRTRHTLLSLTGTGLDLSARLAGAGVCQGRSPCSDSLVSSFVPNPTAVLTPFPNASTTKVAGIAWVLQDTLSRYHTNLTYISRPDGVVLHSTLDGIALANASSSHTLQRLIFPVSTAPPAAAAAAAAAASTDNNRADTQDTERVYWGIINRLRAVWNINKAVPAYDFGPPSAVWRTNNAVGPYLRKKHLGIAACLSWLDYDNSYLPNNKTIAEQRVLYAADAKLALTQLRRFDPALPRLVGNLEGPAHSLTAAQTRVLFDLLPPSERHAGFPIECNKAQTQVLHAHAVAWGLPVATFPLSEQGNPYYELYRLSP